MHSERNEVSSSEQREPVKNLDMPKSKWRRCHNRKTVASRAQIVTATLKGREMLTYSLNFSECRLSSLTAWGEGSVDLYVFDQDGELVAFDNGADTQAHCAWLASARADYMVWVVNNERYPIACSVALQMQ